MAETSRATTTGALGVGGADLMAAADIIADAARELAARWSTSIPPAIRVTGNGASATIICDAAAGYPNEVAGVRHPVFGPTEKNPDPKWVENKHRPFLGAAADQKAGAAMARYAQKIDRMCRSSGFK